jgi:hypothetical protein
LSVPKHRIGIFLKQSKRHSKNDKRICHHDDTFFFAKRLLQAVYEL